MGVNPCCCKEFDTRTMPELFYILETYRTLNCNRYCHSSVAHMNIFKYRYLKTPYRDTYTNGMYYSPCRSCQLNLNRSIRNVTVTQAFTHNRTICLIDIYVANVIKSYDSYDCVYTQIWRVRTCIPSDKLIPPRLYLSYVVQPIPSQHSYS